MVRNAPEPAQSGQAAGHGRSRRILLGIGLGLAVAIGLGCWLVFLPAWRVGRAIDHYCSSPNQRDRAREAVEILGGPKRASQTLSKYLRLPAFVSRDRRIAVGLLGACGEDAAPELSRVVSDEGESPSVRTTAATAMGSAGGQGVEPLLPLLKSRNRELQTAAAESLGRIGDRRAVVPLIALLQHGDNVREEDEAVRLAAVKALGRLGDSRAVPALIDLLGVTYLPLHRWATVALGQIRDPRAVGPLIAAMKSADKRWGYGGQAESALVRIGEPAVQPLIEALQDKDIRSRAVVALARIGAPAETHLRKALGDDRKNVRDGAQEALMRMPEYHPPREKPRN